MTFMESLLVSLASKLELSLCDELFHHEFQIFITETEKDGKRFATKFAIMLENNGTLEHFHEDIDTHKLWKILTELFNRVVLEFQKSAPSAYECYIRCIAGEDEEMENRADECVPENLRRFTRLYLAEYGRHSSLAAGEISMESWLTHGKPKEPPIRKHHNVGCYLPVWEQKQ